MKKVSLLIVSTFLLASCAAQKPKGLYIDEKSGCFVCMNYDSIAVGYKRNPSEKLLYYFYGAYTLEQDKIILSNNSLRFGNSIIVEEYTDYPGIEIQLYELQPYLVLGAPNKHIDSVYYQLANLCEVYFDFDSFYDNIFYRKSKPSAKTSDGIIQIPMEKILSRNTNMIEFFILGCANFFSEIKLVVKSHTRYVIKQKSLYHRPMIPQEVPVVYNAQTNQIEITENSSINYEPYRTFKLKHVGEADSCLGELRKRYPDL